MKIEVTHSRNTLTTLLIPNRQLLTQISTDMGPNDSIDHKSNVKGSIVVVAKCPIPGKSKTRLIPLLGEEGSVRLARGMLSDVVKTIDGCVSSMFAKRECRQQRRELSFSKCISRCKNLFQLFLTIFVTIPTTLALSSLI